MCVCAHIRVCVCVCVCVCVVCVCVCVCVYVYVSGEIVFMCVQLQTYLLSKHIFINHIFHGEYSSV